MQGIFDRCRCRRRFDDERNGDQSFFAEVDDVEIFDAMHPFRREQRMTQSGFKRVVPTAEQIADRFFQQFTALNANQNGNGKPDVSIDRKSDRRGNPIRRKRRQGNDGI